MFGTHIIVHRYARTDMMALGKFSLNIFGFPTASAASCVKGIAAAIAQLVTKVLTDQMQERSCSFAASTRVHNEW